MTNNQNEAFNEIYKIRRLENTEKIESFDCGDEAREAVQHLVCRLWGWAVGEVAFLNRPADAAYLAYEEWLPKPGLRMHLLAVCVADARRLV